MTKGASRDASVDLSSDFVYLSSPTSPPSSPTKLFRLDADTGQIDFYDFPHASGSAIHGRPQSIIPTDIDAKILSSRNATLRAVPGEQLARTKILRELQERIQELTARTKNLTETDNEENKTDSRKEQQLDHARKTRVEPQGGAAAAKKACLAAGCSTLWGGPFQTRSNDSLFSFSERFFGGGTTAHGINRCAAHQRTSHFFAVRSCKQATLSVDCRHSTRRLQIFGQPIFIQCASVCASF
jgi:hypothetical protein